MGGAADLDGHLGRSLLLEPEGNMTRSRFSMLGAMLTLIQLAAVGVSLAPAEEPRVIPAAEVLKQMRQSLARIKSIQYDFQDVHTRNRDGMNVTTTTDASFAWSEGKFYCQNQQDTQPPVFEHLAFDGELYQRLPEDRRYLIVTAEIPKIPYVALQPVLLPYLFVPRRDRRLELETYQSEESWEEITTKATSGEPREIDGHACQVVKFSTPGGIGGELQWEICAAGDLDYFPIQQANQGRIGDRRYDSTFSVKKFVELKSSLGRVVFPLETEVISLNGKGEKIQNTTTKVYETSIKVNQPIDKETFWLKRLKPMRTQFVGNLTDEQKARFEKGPR
jgi:hypothetical protein